MKYKYFFHLYGIKHFTKYFFALIVCAYVATATGIPVYLHYCGGELEEVSYITKSNSCCGEDIDEEPINSDCCKDESTIIKNTFDFTNNAHVSVIPFKSCTDVFFLSKLFNSTLNNREIVDTKFIKDHSPPLTEHDTMLSITILRI